MNDFTFVKKCYPECFNALNVASSDEDNCYYADTGAPSPLLNGVYNCSTDDEKLEDVVDGVLNHYREKQLPHSWWVEVSNQPKRLSDLLAKHGFQSIGTFPAMLLKVEEFNPNVVPDVCKIERVEDPSGLMPWSEVVGEAFDFNHDAISAYANIFNNETMKGCYYHLLARVDGEPVCTGTVLCTDNGAYIYNVATALNARNKGYARHMMTALINIVKEKNLRRVALISSPQAIKLYESLGFKQVTQYNIFMEPVWVM